MNASRILTTRFRLTVLVVALSAAAGCGPKVVTPPETTHGGWTALQEFSMDTLMIVGPDATQGRWAAVRKGAGSDAFKKGVEKLGSAELPTNLSSHKALKDETVANLRNLVAAAKTAGGNQELQAAWEAAKVSLDKLTAAIQ